MEEPLLDSIDLDPRDKRYEDDYRPRPKASKSRNVCKFLALQLGLITLYTFIFAYILKATRLTESPLQPAYSPARSSIRYEERYFKKFGHLTSPFSGPPGDRVDAEWHRLLAGMNIRVSPEYIDKYGATSIRLTDGSGYVAQLGVYHELHCLKKLKHWIYREHYYPHLSPDDLEEERLHSEHCLEWLRTAALCRSDTTLTTLEWSGPNKTRLTTQYPIPHQCVDSDKVLEWSEANAVDVSQEGLLEGPE